MRDNLPMKIGGILIVVWCWVCTVINVVAFLASPWPACCVPFLMALLMAYWAGETMRKLHEDW